jgi:ABC-type branched-subunit amino acid transport system ATPase component/ABC-type branched-subunit amino acid transport system permease subunit
MDYLRFGLLGLGSGGVFVALAISLQIFYRTSNVINVAAGPIAMYAAYTYALLVNNGGFFNPIIGLPVAIHIHDHIPAPVALIISVLAAAVLGVILEQLIFRPMRHALPLARLIAALGVMVVIQADVGLRLGTTAVSVPAIFPQSELHIFGGTVPSDGLYIAGIVVAVALASWAVYQLTPFGLRTRAAAETEKGAQIVGLRTRRLSAINWAIGAGMAGLGGVLIAPVLPLTPSAYTLLVVPALSATLIGGFTRTGPIVVGGLLVGMAESVAVLAAADNSWLPQVGLGDAIPLILVIVLLVVKGAPLPRRGEIVTQTLPASPRPQRIVAPLVVGVALCSVLLCVLDANYRAALISSLIFMIVCLSMVVCTGIAGQISLAQLTIAGVSGFLLSRYATNAGIPFPWSPLLAALSAALAGVVLGLPALRVRGVQLAVLTLAMGVAAEYIYLENPQWNGGFDGANVPEPRLFGLDFGIGSGAAYPRIGFGFFILAIFVVCALGVVALRRSALGMRMLAVRANERGAAAAGVNVAHTKLIGFAIAAFIAGIAGTLFGYQQVTLSADSFDILVGISLFAIAYVSGISTVSGAVVGGALATGGLVYVFLSNNLHLGNYYILISGLGLIAMAMTTPDGIVGNVRRQWGWLASRIGLGRSGAKPPEPAAAADDVIELAKVSRRPEPGVKGSVVLAVRRLSIRFGGVTAVDDVTLDVREGEILGLMGPNGAGKSSFTDGVTGFTHADGEVVFLGERIDGKRAHERARLGLLRTFQSSELFEDLEVLENVVVGVAHHRTRGKSVTDRALDALRLVNLDHLADIRVAELSQGHHKLVTIARAIAGDPRLLILDEPAAGLDENESEQLGRVLRRLCDGGLSMLLIEHDVSLLSQVCDRLAVLNFGRLIGMGRPADVTRDPVVVAAYLGRSDVTAVT